MKSYGIWFGIKEHNKDPQYIMSVSVSTNNKQQAKDFAIEVLNSLNQEELEQYIITDNQFTIDSVIMARFVGSYEIGGKHVN